MNCSQAAHRVGHLIPLSERSIVLLTSSNLKERTVTVLSDDHSVGHAQAGTVTMYTLTFVRVTLRS